MSRPLVPTIAKLLEAIPADDPARAAFETGAAKIAADAWYTAPEAMPRRWDALASLLQRTYPEGEVADGLRRIFNG